MGGKVSKDGKRYPYKKGMSNVEYYRDRRIEAEKKGVCSSHPYRKAAKNNARCQQCLNRSRELSERKRKAGLCQRHVDVPAVEGKSLCQECLLNKRLGWMRRKGVSESEIKVTHQAWLTFDGKCQDCGTSEPGTKGWVGDHGHEDLKFRGILCSSCNLALGHLKDSVIRLNSLIVYLERTSGEKQ